MKLTLLVLIVSFLQVKCQDADPILFVNQEESNLPFAELPPIFRGMMPFLFGKTTTTTTTTTPKPTTTTTTTRRTTTTLFKSPGDNGVTCSYLDTIALNGIKNFYMCCGNEVYDWREYKCVLERGIPKLAVREEPTTTEAPVAELVITCNTINYFVAADQAEYYACCGSELLDTRLKTCPKSRAPTLMDTAKLMGFLTKPSANCAEGYTCCTDFVPVYDPKKMFRCCPGNGPYNPVVETCRRAVVAPSS